MLNAVPEIKELFHSQVFFYFTHKIYGIQVNIGCDLHVHVSTPVCPTGVVHVFLHVEVTPEIDLDSMKYKSSLNFGSAYSFAFKLLLFHLLNVLEIRPKRQKKNNFKTNYHLMHVKKYCKMLK